MMSFVFSNYLLDGVDKAVVQTNCIRMTAVTNIKSDKHRKWQTSKVRNVKSEKRQEWETSKVTNVNGGKRQNRLRNLVLNYLL